MLFDLTTRTPDGTSGGTNNPSGNRMAINELSPLIDLIKEEVLPGMTAEEETKPNGRWELKKLNSRHREIMRQILEGATYTEIASVVGMSTQAVMLIANSSIFKEELAKLEAEADGNVIRRAEELSNEALSRLRDHMRRARSEALQASCAEKILGIGGYSRIEKKQIAVVSGEEVIRELNRRRREQWLSSAEQHPQSEDSSKPIEADRAD